MTSPGTTSVRDLRAQPRPLSGSLSSRSRHGSPPARSPHDPGTVHHHLALLTVGCRTCPAPTSMRTDPHHPLARLTIPARFTTGSLSSPWGAGLVLHRPRCARILTTRWHASRSRHGSPPARSPHRGVQDLSCTDLDAHGSSPRARTSLVPGHRSLSSRSRHGSPPARSPHRGVQDLSCTDLDAHGDPTTPRSPRRKARRSPTRRYGVALGAPASCSGGAPP